MLEAGLGTRIRQKGGDGEIAGLPVGMNPKNRAYSAVFASSKGRGQLRLHIWWVAQRRNLERAVEKADACLTSVGKPPSNFFLFFFSQKAGRWLGFQKPSSGWPVSPKGEAFRAVKGAWAAGCHSHRSHDTGRGARPRSLCPACCMAQVRDAGHWRTCHPAAD